MLFQMLQHDRKYLLNVLDSLDGLGCYFQFVAKRNSRRRRRRKKEEGRRKKEEGRRKKEEGRRKKSVCTYLVLGSCIAVEQQMHSLRYRVHLLFAFFMFL